MRMTSRLQRLGRRQRAILLSLAVAALPALLVVAAYSQARSSDAAAGVAPLDAAPAVVRSTPLEAPHAAVAVDDIAPAPQPAAGATAAAVAPGVGLEPGPSNAAAASTSPPVRSPQPAPAVAAVMRIRIPSLGVDAPVIDLPLDTNTLPVPGDAATVGWYSFSSLPGEQGNALLAGHIDFRGEVGVFRHLAELSVGDVIEIAIGDGAYVYRVTGSQSLPYDTPVAQVLETLSGPPRLTLLTCGGTFDRSRRGYDERVIVSAVQVPPETAALRD